MGVCCSLVQMYSGSQCSQKRLAMNWWRRWNTTVHGLEANTRLVTHQSSLRCVSVDSSQFATKQAARGGWVLSQAARSQEMLYEDEKNFKGRKATRANVYICS